MQEAAEVQRRQEAEAREEHRLRAIAEAEAERAATASRAWVCAASAAIAASQRERELSEEAERLRAKEVQRKALLERLRDGGCPTSKYDLDLRNEELWERIWATHADISRLQACQHVRCLSVYGHGLVSVGTW